MRYRRGEGMKYNNILETIGKTPLVRLNRLTDETSAEVYVKLESSNPMRSEGPHRAGDDREGRGGGKDTTGDEHRAGRTDVGEHRHRSCDGLRRQKLNLVLTMPESMSLEKEKTSQGDGRRAVLTPKAAGMKGAVECAKGLCEEGRTPSCRSSSTTPLTRRFTTKRQRRR